MTIKDYSDIFYPSEMRKEEKERDNSTWLLVVLVASLVAIAVHVFLEPTHAEARNGYATTTPEVSLNAPIVATAIEFCAQSFRDHEGEELPKSIKEVCL